MAHCLCDADGALLCANGKGEIPDETVAALAAKGAKAISRVWERASEINGLSEAAVKEAEGN